MRKWELEDLIAEHEEAMEKAYDAILDGDPEAAREILAEALDLDEGEEADDETDSDGGEGGEE